MPTTAGLWPVVEILCRNPQHCGSDIAYGTPSTCNSRHFPTMCRFEKGPHFWKPHGKCSPWDIKTSWQSDFEKDSSHLGSLGFTLLWCFARLFKHNWTSICKVLLKQPHSLPHLRPPPSGRRRNAASPEGSRARQRNGQSFALTWILPAPSCEGPLSWESSRTRSWLSDYRSLHLRKEKQNAARVRCYQLKKYHLVV